ncbi:MAG: L,D-transpeptidase [Rhizobiaceae bacterium]
MASPYCKNKGGKGPTSRKRGRIRLITVRARPANRLQGLIVIAGTVYPCALGRGGIVTLKREGDGGTPLALMRLLAGYFVRRRMRPPRLLPMHETGPALGWCEVPDDRNYNRPVRMPYPASHETMLRPDGLYDACLVLDWNIRPRRRNAGSAIFFHLARPGLTPTEGCIAVSRAVMTRLLPHLSDRTIVRVVR